VKIRAIFAVTVLTPKKMNDYIRPTRGRRRLEGGSEVYPRFSRAGLDEIRFGECLVCVGGPAEAGRPNDGFPVVFFDK
jgi:hypothetical protein